MGDEGEETALPVVRAGVGADDRLPRHRRVGRRGAGAHGGVSTFARAQRQAVSLRRLAGRGGRRGPDRRGGVRSGAVRDGARRARPPVEVHQHKHVDSAVAAAAVFPLLDVRRARAALGEGGVCDLLWHCAAAHSRCAPLRAGRIRRLHHRDVLLRRLHRPACPVDSHLRAAGVGAHLQVRLPGGRGGRRRRPSRRRRAAGWSNRDVRGRSAVGQRK